MKGCRWPKDNATVSMPARFFAVRDGKVARVTNYYNPEDWIRQVGG